MYSTVRKNKHIGSKCRYKNSPFGWLKGLFGGGKKTDWAQWAKDRRIDARLLQERGLGGAKWDRCEAYLLAIGRRTKEQVRTGLKPQA